MNAVPVLKVDRVWVCANDCGARGVTYRGDVHTQMHPCPKMGGLMAPMIRQGSRAKQFMVEREDYVGDREDLLTLDDNGRPAMNVTTIRDDGQDCTIFAPLVSSEGRS